MAPFSRDLQVAVRQARTAQNAAERAALATKGACWEGGLMAEWSESKSDKDDNEGVGEGEGESGDDDSHGSDADRLETLTAHTDQLASAFGDISRIVDAAVEVQSE